MKEEVTHASERRDQQTPSSPSPVNTAKSTLTYRTNHTEYLLNFVRISHIGNSRKSSQKPVEEKKKKEIGAGPAP